MFRASPHALPTCSPSKDVWSERYAMESKSKEDEDMREDELQLEWRNKRRYEWRARRPVYVSDLK